MKEKCSFCSPFLKQTAGVVYEDEQVYVLVADDWVIKGHTLVIWKKHVVNISDLSKEEYLAFSQVVYKVEKVLLQMLNKDKSIILKSGGIISHFHFHIYPLLSTTPWHEIQKILDIKVHYHAKQGEKKEFLARLQKNLQ